MSRFGLWLGVLTLGFGVSGFASECVPADLIFSGGHIITMNSERRVVSALALRDGRIEAAGTDQLIASCAGMMTKKVDLKGHTLLPGFIDWEIRRLPAATLYRTQGET